MRPLYWRAYTSKMGKTRIRKHVHSSVTTIPDLWKQLGF